MKLVASVRATFRRHTLSDWLLSAGIGGVFWAVGRYAWTHYPRPPHNGQPLVMVVAMVAIAYLDGNKRSGSPLAPRVAGLMVVALVTQFVLQGLTIAGVFR